MDYGRLPCFRTIVRSISDQLFTAIWYIIKIKLQRHHFESHRIVLFHNKINSRYSFTALYSPARRICIQSLENASNQDLNIIWPVCKKYFSSTALKSIKDRHDGDTHIMKSPQVWSRHAFNTAPYKLLLLYSYVIVPVVFRHKNTSSQIAAQRFGFNHQNQENMSALFACNYCIENIHPFSKFWIATITGSDFLASTPAGLCKLDIKPD